MLEYITLALSLTHTVYGLGEGKCGDITNPVGCLHGAVTASGEIFRPNEVPSAAVPMPTKLKLRVSEVYIRHTSLPNTCVKIRVNDKGNPRYIGVRGLDLTPAALSAVGITPTKYWSGRLEACRSKS